jgi:glycosyltransferase involved in cell wall biosynthesis
MNNRAIALKAVDDVSHPVRSLSVIVTAMNEELNLRPTIESVLSVVDTPAFDCEILIIDDGSRDRTGAIADELAAANPRIRVHHHPRNLGLDRAYLKGIELATKEHIGWVAGNNIIPAEALRDIYGRIGQADIVLSYPVVDIRRKRRRWLSRWFVHVLNMLFGVRLRYYTGPCVYRADVAKSLRTISGGSMIVPEIVIRLIKSGQSYVEVSLRPKPRTAGKTKTFRLSNVTYVGMSVLRLFVDIRLPHPSRLKTSPEPHTSPD